jgi:hypothetical protein
MSIKYELKLDLYPKNRIEIVLGFNLTQILHAYEIKDNRYLIIIIFVTNIFHKDLRSSFL